jgi:hypothetical protein
MHWPPSCWWQKFNQFLIILTRMTPSRIHTHKKTLYHTISHRILNEALQHLRIKAGGQPLPIPNTSFKWSLQRNPNSLQNVQLRCSATSQMLAYMQNKLQMTSLRHWLFPLIKQTTRFGTEETTQCETKEPARFGTDEMIRFQTEEAAQQKPGK